MSVLVDLYLKLPLILAEVASPGASSAPAGPAAPAAPGGAGGPPPPSGTESLMSMAVMFLPFIIVIYFFMIRPENKRRNEHTQLMNSLKTKDKVVTIGGLHGTVVEVEKDEVVILVDAKKDVKLRFNRTAIASIDSGESTEEKK